MNLNKDTIGDYVKEWVTNKIDIDFKFRQYQFEAIVNIIDNIINHGHRNYVIEAPTGSGKSLINIISAGVLADYFDLTSYIQGASDYEIMCKLVELYNSIAADYNKLIDSNKEVIDFAQSKTDVVLGNNMNKKLAYRMLTDSSYETVIIPATAANSQLYVGLACGTTALESFEIEDLSLQRTQVDYTFTHRICEFRKTNSYVDDDNIFSGTSITSTTREDTEHFSYDGTMTTRWPLTIDVNKLASLSDNAKKSFTIETTVTATRYTKDGTSESAGGGEELKLYCHIKLDDSLVNIPSKN